MINSDKRNVLVLGTYPIVQPKHGGQIRLLNIKKAYQRAGWNAVSLAIYPEESYSKSDADAIDIPFSSESPYRFFNGRFVYFITDYLSGVFASAENGGLKQVLARIPSKIDVIHVEQPWLWPLALKLRKRPEYASALLVYGSQNIEEPLKRGIFESYVVNDSEDALEAIGLLEKQAARCADLTLAVTQEEADVLSAWGAQRVLLLPNGIEPWQTEASILDKWRSKLPRHPWMLYVASAHPPNFSHFAEIFGGALGCFPPTSKLVVAGSVSEHIYSAMSATKWSALNHSRLELLFSLSDQDLAAVKTLAHGFVLPIPFGGGSNIKTAEALYSGTYVVGTPAAFRGYDKFMELPVVRVGENPRSFQKAIREVLSLPRASSLDRDSEGFEIRQKLRWDKCLERLPAEIERIQRQKVDSE